MLDSIYYMTLRLGYLKSHFCCKNVTILSLQLCTHVVMDVITFPENLLTTSGLSILIHSVISLP